MADSGASWIDVYRGSARIDRVKRKGTRGSRVSYEGKRYKVRDGPGGTFRIDIRGRFDYRRPEGKNVIFFPDGVHTHVFGNGFRKTNGIEVVVKDDVVHLQAISAAYGHRLAYAWLTLPKDAGVLMELALRLRDLALELDPLVTWKFERADSGAGTEKGKED
jgi:hypothetical protein